jgi:hypothetical protein
MFPSENLRTLQIRFGCLIKGFTKNDDLFYAADMHKSRGKQTNILYLNTSRYDKKSLYTFKLSTSNSNDKRTLILACIYCNLTTCFGSVSYRTHCSHLFYLNTYLQYPRNTPTRMCSTVHTILSPSPKTSLCSPAHSLSTQVLCY